jgi:glycosyltransferase involved in cell wall biosynthesis
MRLALWSPLPPSPSGIADYVAETLPLLARRVQLTLVVEDVAAVDPELRRDYDVRGCGAAPDANLDVYHLGNSPAHAYAYRAALRRPGVAVLHDFSLHHLVLHETLERGARSAYLHEMRRAYGERGSFVGRQVARALGGDLLPSLFPLSERVLDSSLGVVGLTAFVRERAALRLPPGHPTLHLPHHLALPHDPPPSREEAREALGLDPGALIVTAPGLATASKRLDVAVRALARLRSRFPALRLVVAGAVDPRLPLVEWARTASFEDALLLTGRLTLPDFERHLCAADVVLGLRFPSHGEISGALLRALGVGRPVLVTGGTPASEEFPEGVVVPVDPGRAEEEQLVALLARLLEDAGLREAISRAAREHVRAHHDLGATVERLVTFLGEVLARKDETLRALETERAPAGSLLEYLLEETRWAAADLGLAGYHTGVEPLLAELLGSRP